MSEREKRRTRRAQPRGPVRSARCVRDVMTRRPVTVDAGAPLEQVRAILLWSSFRHLPVLDGDRLLGILSDRDVLAAVTEHGAEAAMSLAAREIAHRGVVSTSPDATLPEAANALVAREIGCLPVVEAGRLVGIVTAKDLLGEGSLGAIWREVGAARAAEPRAREIMTADPVCAPEDAPLFDAVADMAEGGVRHLPVVDAEGRLVGMLSDRDVRAAVGDPREELTRGTRWEIEGRTVRDVMRQDPVRVELDSTVSEIASALVDERVGAVPVVDEDDHPVGIVSYVDLLASQPGAP